MSESQDPFIQALDHADKFASPSEPLEFIFLEDLHKHDLTKMFFVCPKCRFKEDATNKPETCSNCDCNLSDS